MIIPGRLEDRGCRLPQIIGLATSKLPVVSAMAAAMGVRTTDTSIPGVDDGTSTTRSSNVVAVS